MKTVLVTGSTGRLGLNLVKALRERGYEVVGFAFDTPAEKELRAKLEQLGAEVVLGNLATGEGIDEAVCKADAVIHAAALMQEDRARSREAFFDINTRGTFHLLEAVRRRNGQMTRFVGVTTGAVYDTRAGTPPHRETNELRPLKLYGLCKVLNEQLYRLFHFQDGLPTITLRPNYILAGTEACDTWKPGFIVGTLKACAGDKRSYLHTRAKEPWKQVEALIESPDDLIIPYGPNGKAWRWHTTDVRDAVHGCICALETQNPKAFGGIFNITAARPQPWDVAVKHLAKRTGRTYREVQLPVWLNVHFDVSRAKRILGYKPQYDIKRMIDDALAFKAGQDTGVIPPGIPH
ncbi:MAG: NAD(P)-dependent oxidoreductase [Kiritimatiellae bacterium]|nr:NAD(P)-dependent oxidoreductase [Kiritimatiellia bacterium]